MSLPPANGSDGFVPTGRGAAAACLMTAAGASLDGCVFLRHGHVLANAQSGNLVLFALALAQGQGAEALRHVPSFAAFVLGVAAAHGVSRPLKRHTPNSRPIRLWLEAAALAALAALRLPDTAVVSAVAFIAAFQVSSFSHLGRLSFSTGMATGNLIKGVQALANLWTAEGRGARAGDRAEAALLVLLLVAFLLGAGGGGWLALRYGDGALLATAALTIAAGVLLLSRR